ncbi:unnamed protein product [Heligmosomoides polygyrus]|uniref:Fringe glycosyltransferase n=1 Tax=Heligmosomoides polygyrus TaxID=6339 RepID=A0A183G4D1_HELPZ|nr:unnamed protein product [Heligmosomoides polygyrus]
MNHELSFFLAKKAKNTYVCRVELIKDETADIGASPFCAKNRQHLPFRWSCHFDDDNYVNVQALRRLLSSRNSSLPWYIGKSSTLRPLNIPMKSKGKIPIWFATGGAGICLSQALLEKLGPYTEKQKFEGFCDVYMLPDDVTLGFIISKCLLLELCKRAEQIDIQNVVKPSTCIPRKGKLILTVFISIFGDVIKFIVFTLSDPFRMLQALGE